MLAAALGFGITTVTTKMLTITESTVSILFWMNLMQLPLNLAGSSAGFLHRIDGSMTLPLLAVCVGGLAAHVCLTSAYRYGDTIMVVPLDFLRIPLIALVGWQFYGERVDPFVFAGAGLIIAGVLWNLRAEAKT
jgi:drug/metabolite transporter (DMT)-like permease